jgi:hypothetical protein
MSGLMIGIAYAARNAKAEIVSGDAVAFCHVVCVTRGIFSTFAQSRSGAYQGLAVATPFACSELLGPD